MNPLQPQDAFGATHVAALLLLGVDAMAQNVEAMATGGSPNAFAEPHELDYALLGLCALRSHIRELAGSEHQRRPAGEPSWLIASDRVLR